MNAKLQAALNILVLILSTISSAQSSSSELICTNKIGECRLFFPLVQSENICSRYGFWVNGEEKSNFKGIGNSGIEVSIKTAKKLCSNSQVYISISDMDFPQLLALGRVFENFMRGSGATDNKSQDRAIFCVRKIKNVSLIKFNPQDIEEKFSRAAFFIDTDCGDIYISSDISEPNPKLRIEASVEFKRFEVESE